MRNATHVICLRNCALLAIFLMGAPPVTHAAERITYYHTDALGSPVAATDQQGNVVWRETYEPYGERIKKEPASSTNARWHTGHVLDAETGLQYAGARYYDPVLGRFMGADSASFTETNPHSFNRYNYGNNNPYKYIDPDGRAGVEFQPGGLVRCAAEGGCRQLGGGGGGAAMQRSLPETAASPATKSEQTFQRAVTNTELEATRNTGLLRGGREGENFFTNSVPSDAKRAHQRLGLDGPLRDARIEFRIKNDVEVTGPRVAKPGESGTPGGGREFSTNEPTKIEIIRVDPLRK